MIETSCSRRAIPFRSHFRSSPRSLPKDTVPFVMQKSRTRALRERWKHLVLISGDKLKLTGLSYDINTSSVRRTCMWRHRNRDNAMDLIAPSRRTVPSRRTASSRGLQNVPSVSVLPGHISLFRCRIIRLSWRVRVMRVSSLGFISSPGERETLSCWRCSRFESGLLCLFIGVISISESCARRQGWRSRCVRVKCAVMSLTFMQTLHLLVVRRVPVSAMRGIRHQDVNILPL